MKSVEYRNIIRTISLNALTRRFPGLKRKELEEVAITISKNVHARMYGANVDNVASPIWRNETEKQPDVNATEMLKQSNEKESQNENV